MAAACGPDESHRRAVTGRDSQGDPCTLIVYRLTAPARGGGPAEYAGHVVRVVVVSVNSTERGAVAFSPAQAIEAADALYTAAGAVLDTLRPPGTGERG